MEFDSLVYLHNADETYEKYNIVSFSSQHVTSETEKNRLRSIIVTAAVLNVIVWSCGDVMGMARDTCYSGSKATTVRERGTDKRAVNNNNT